MEPLDFLKVARLLSADSDEASLRTAIGRCYYAVFLPARSLFIRRHGAPPRGRSVHGWVTLRLQTAHPEVGVALAGLRDLRNLADYELDVAVSARDAAQALYAAEWIARSLDKY